MKADFLGYEVKGQIVAASCPATESPRTVRLCAKSGAAAVILKTASSTRMGDGHGRTCRIDDTGFWAKSGFDREILDMEEGLSLLKACGDSAVPLVSSITELDLDTEKWLADCEAVEKTGAAAIQLDLFYMENLLSEDGFEDKFTQLLSEIRRHAHIPVMPKLNIGLPAEYACYLLKKAGIIYVSLLDSVKSPAPLVFNPRGRLATDPALAGSGLSVFGGFMLPLTRQYAAVLCGAGFKVCAGGGVTSAFDAAGLLLLGADTVQIATEVLLHGYERFGALNSETDTLLRKAGLYCPDRVKEETPRLYRQDYHKAPREARWNSRKCRFCSSCFPAKQAFCGRIFRERAALRIRNCEGCGLCAGICPYGAIEIENI